MAQRNGVVAELRPMVRLKVARARACGESRRRTWRSSSHSRSGWLAAILAVVAAGAFSGRAQESQNQENSSAKPRPAIEIVQHGGYPELRVEGEPFFIRSAAFFYYRIPRDQWEQTLTTYRSLGINTIDLYIPWNWHELKEGEFDFDGHTNSRRDLRSLLALIAYQRLRLIARPGPEILNEWKNGGYPDWLLERPEYRMGLVDRLEGHYPPLDSLNPSDAEAAARGWLENATHMDQARKWLSEVGKELAPYAPSRAEAAASDKKSVEASHKSNTLLFVQLGDDFAEGRFNRVGAEFWRYLESLRGAIAAGGADVSVFINPTDMRVPAAGSMQSPPVGVMGQWYLRPQAGIDGPAELFSARDASDIEFFTEQLKTQPAFPPILMEYQAGWYAPGDDDHPTENPPDNSLLGSRLLIANGIHGINYFPLQDTFSPARESVPWVNRSYRWNAAFSPDGERQPRMRSVERDSYFFARWGTQLAASHKRTDFGIVNPVGSYAQDQLSSHEIAEAVGLEMRLERLGALAMLASEILDPEHQSAKQLMRDPVIFLPVLDPAKTQVAISERAQEALVEYVRYGGTLIVFPMRPGGRAFDRMWRDATAEPEEKSGSTIRARWKFGDGELIESSKDFLSRLALDRSLSENREQREASWAIGVLRELLAAAGVHPSVKVSENATGAGDLIATEIVTNEGSAPLGKRTGGRGFVSVTNLSSDDTVDATLEALSPVAGARGTGLDYIPVRVNLPPRESLLLPLNAPICKGEGGNTPCEDVVTSGGAEFLDARREGKSLSLLFYTPAREEVHFHFDAEPSRVTIDDNKPEMSWDGAKKDLQVFLPRGPAPRYHRVLKIDLPYKARVPETEKPRKQSLYDLSFVVANAVRLPTSDNAFLRTYPPLIVPDSHGSYGVLVQGESHVAGELQIVNISVDGPFRGSGNIRVLPEGPSVEKIPVKLAQKDSATQPASGKVWPGTMELRLGRDRITIPVAFLQPRDQGTTNYRFDFDRDGADEWVLENAGLRLIVSPESGGRAIALMDKVTGLNLSTSVGLLRDNFSFAENPAGTNPERARGRYGLFNRPYSAEWVSQETNPVLKMRYDAPDIFPFGANIEKSAQFEGAETLRVDYRVALLSPRENGDVSERTHAQSFVAVNSFPAIAEPGQVTRVCWAAGSSEDHGDSPDKNSAETGEEAVCSDFIQGGKTIEVPIGMKRVEIRTPGRAGMAIEWECRKTCARMTIEPKKFSALFRLEFPRLIPGGEAENYTVRLKIIGAP
jgi:Glycosyl hydrolases family 35